MKQFMDTRGWLIGLRGGPRDGWYVRVGWKYPNGQRDPIPTTLTFGEHEYRIQPLASRKGEPQLLGANQGRDEWNAIRPIGFPADQKAVYVYAGTK